MCAGADSAAMESFFSLLQKNVLNRQRWLFREELRLAIVVRVEKTYHRRRRPDALGRMTRLVRDHDPGRAHGPIASTDQSQLKSGSPFCSHWVEAEGVRSTL